MSDDKFSYGEPFQRKLLSLMVLDPIFLQNSYDAIKPQYFSYDEHMAIARIVLDYYRQFGVTPTRDSLAAIIHEHVNKYNVQDPTKSHMMNLGEVIFTYDFHDQGYIKDRALHFGRRQALSAALMKAAEIIHSDTNLDKILPAIEEGSRIGTSKDFGIVFRDKYSRIKEMIAEEGMYNPMRKCATLIGGLDRKLGGGLGVGELGSVLGTTAGGKSMTLINFGAAAMIAGKHVIHFTIGDLGEFDAMVRYSSRLSGVPMDTIIAGDESYKEIIGRSTAMGSHLRIKYFPPKTAHTHHIKAFLSQVRSIDKVEPGLVIVDYADKLATDGGGDDDYRDLGKVYDELIAIAREFKCPIWTASQTNRQARGKNTAGVEDIADSWQKVANADVCISLNATDEEIAKNEIRLFGAKVRRGESSFTVRCRFERNRCFLQEQQMMAVA